MNEITLLKPNSKYAGQIMAYSEEMLRSGGVLKNEVADEAGLTDSGIIQRYRIKL